MERERTKQNRSGLGSSGESPLPEGWCWTRLGNIAEIVSGNSPPSWSYNREGRGVPLINGPTEFGPRPFDHPKTLQYTEAPTKFCEVGDLLVCVRGSTGRTNVASFRASIGRDIAAVRSAECQPYVNHYVVSQANRLRSVVTGSMLTGITPDQLRQLALPLPPLSEQHRIVAAIEESLANVDAGIDSLEQARKDLVRMRTAVLRSAVTGELTKTARAVSQESAADLLSRVLSERRLRGMAHSPGQRSLSESSERYQESTEPETHPSDTLPEGWAWARLGQLCEIQLGRAKSPSKRSNLYPTKYLRAANITEEGLDLADLLEMEFDPRERDAFRLRSGDLVVAEASGSADKVGKPAIWNDELPLCCFQNTVIRLRPYLLESSYVLLLLRHCYFNRVFAKLSDGMGINHLGAGRLSQVVVPLAPEGEQRIMVEEVERQLESIKASRESIDSNLARARDLRSAVLLQAFRGELVERKPSDEGAQALVERISLRLSQGMTITPLKAGNKGVHRMKASAKHRPLLDVLREHPNGITPEALLTAANYAITDVDRFYSELSRIADSVLEEKPEGKAARTWPYGARVLLRLRD